jgi:aspartyl-tRNA(Asn)/glutamyl-tRNA(Gln) amidotransferase subunit C
MNLDLATVRHVASLSKLDLTSDEEQRLSAELGAILDMVERLRETPAQNIPTAVHGSPLREDIAHAVDTRDAALAQAPSAQDGYFLVPRVIE